MLEAIMSLLFYIVWLSFVAYIVVSVLQVAVTIVVLALVAVWEGISYLFK